MDTKSKKLGSYTELMAMMPYLGKFQKIHNKLRLSYQVLLDITERNKENKEEFETLCRSCLVNLFSLIEADIFYYNLFDKYENYEDSHRFFDKFKETFKQICKTWDRESLQTEYFQTKLQTLKELKDLRDSLTHPKEITDILDPTIKDFKKIAQAFEDYDKFILTLMSNFFFSVELPGLFNPKNGA